MRWRYFAVAAELGIKEGVPCSVCGCLETDILYSPMGISDRQANWIETIWGCDPFADFVVCEGCMEGHCGLSGFPELNADSWLKKRIKEFKAQRAVHTR